MVIAKGEKIALVGSNGSGKSTLVSLLLGLEANYTGSIELDGHNIRSVANLSDIMSVAQETYLFSDSVFNNLNMGMEKCEDSIAKMAEILGLDYITDINMMLSD